MYFSSARNLADGVGLGMVSADGVYTPLQIFAPFYPIVLSLFAHFNLDLIQVNVVLNILFFALLVMACGWLFYRLSGSWLLALCFALLISATPVLARDYTSLMSEPLAIVLGIPGFLLLLLAIKIRSVGRLLLAGLLLGLSFMTRYAFVAFPIAGVLAVFFLSQSTWKKRFGDTLLFAAISILPMGLWVIRQVLQQSSIGARKYVLDGSALERARLFISSFYGVIKYWFPYRSNMIPGVSSEIIVPLLLSVFILMVAGGLIFSAVLRKTHERQYGLWLLLLGFIFLAVVYCGFLLITVIISSQLISIDGRMLSPLPIMIYGILLAASLSLALKFPVKFSVPVMGLLITVLFVSYNFLEMQTYQSNMAVNPDGYASPTWRGKPIFTAAEKIPAGVPILSNAPNIVLFYTHVNSYFLSSEQKSNRTTVTLADFAMIDRLMKDECGAIVILNQKNVNVDEKRNKPMSANDLKILSKAFTAIYDEKDGKILMYRNCIQ
jgi:4-amino-4-deoxy-L-arabinose transferase-like glycosyltransferase